MTSLKKKPEQSFSAGIDEPWPFKDDLDEYEREIEASFARGEWRPVVNHEAELKRYREMARIALETGNYGPVPKGVPCPPGWLEYVRGAKANGGDTEAKSG